MPPPITLSHLPFLLHALLEILASIKFFLQPLGPPSPSSPSSPSSSSSSSSQTPITPLPSSSFVAQHDTIAIIRQYSLLLLSTALVSLIFALRPLDTTSRRVAAALSIYHLAPLARAVGRIGDDWNAARSHAEGVKGVDLGGPWVHAVVHAVAFGGLAALWVGPLLGFGADGKGGVKVKR